MPQPCDVHHDRLTLGQLSPMCVVRVVRQVRRRSLDLRLDVVYVGVRQGLPRLFGRHGVADLAAHDAAQRSDELASDAGKELADDAHLPPFSFSQCEVSS
jgi:hypothetical protein